MKVIRKEDVQPVDAARKRVRAGGLGVIRLAVGTPGTAGNFLFAHTTTNSDYAPPRHRHNFEQIRFQLRGEFDYDRDGKMTEGTVGYFPEGTFYGPSKSGDGSEFVILQFGGASGSGYMSHGEYDAAMARLGRRGGFHDGIYTWFDANGKKHNKDGYEAAWEESRQCELQYPKPRYERPVFMRPDNFAWRTSRDEPGVSFKPLGSFGEREVRVGFVRLEAGVTARKLPADTLYYVVSGKGSAAGEAWHVDSALHLAKGESGEISAVEAAEMFYIGFPDLEGLQFPKHQHQEVAAAA
jgi:hypothetical protein